MRRMKRTLLATLLLATAACSSGGGTEGTMTETDFETKIASAIAFDPSLLHPGDRVVYFVKRSGETQTQKYSWAAVAEEPGSAADRREPCSRSRPSRAPPH